MKKFLITYSTVDGHTKNICQKIADYSKSTQMDVLPISQVMDIQDYDFIVSFAFSTRCIGVDDYEL